MGNEKDDDGIARAVLDSSPNAVVALDRDQTVLVWTPAAERLFGWTAEEVIGRRSPIVPEELIAEHNAVLERARIGGEVSLRTKRLRRDGSLIDVRVDTSALRLASGTSVGYVCVHHLPQADEEARVARRARLVRRLTDVVGDINAELELPAVLDRIVAGLTELTGADASGFVLIEGEKLRLVSADGLPSSLRGATADLRDSLVGKLLRTGKTVMLETEELDDLLWSRLPGLHSIALGLAAVGGRPYGALYALFAESTAGHVELELLELLAGHAGIAVGNAMAYQDAVRQRAHQRAVFDASADGIAVLDGEGLVTQWNPAAAELTGYAEDTVIGSPPPFPLPAPGEKLTFQLESSGRWLDVVAAKIPETGETVIDFRDVTRAKELEEAKDLFLATTSHELRTPITVVRGFASMLDARWDKLSDAERRAAVHTIAERARSLGTLMDHLLLGARAGAEELPVRIEPFDLGGLVRGATLGLPVLSDRHRVEVSVPDDLPLVSGDELATDIVLGQLLENAFKYSPEGGLIRVEARREGDKVVLLVEDEGVGIAPADLERIFERFVQVDSGDRRRFGGVGLGLYIVRSLARAQGGDVSAHQRPGGGTTMRLVLNVAEPST
ncbi:PAS domain S-box protein [Thermostaphylospora chromogena]|uniref:histidine kinase n=1 Tax=Thermostaphylospora chromogena TaxID=35622 RepID=A0A1H1CUH8_9ACTN|nr:PAS domain S-box protein [Thermostaphylospora chromogena]SDQ67921.1 PAS domain S-box-containing protein [Thermostaphylospora chromogena]